MSQEFAPLLSSGFVPVGSGGGGGGTISDITSTGGTITITNPTGPTVNIETAGAAPTFNLIGSGTNTTATMVVGTGASLAASGSGTITATAVPVGGISGLGTGVATFLATPSSANLAAAVTDETGTGALVFASAPTLSNPIVGTQAFSDNSTKAASTAYVTTGIANAIAGVNPAVAVQAATTANVTGYTYNNGVSGIGATLTQNSAAVVVIDGYTLLLGDRVLFKNQTTSANNGVYFVSTLGTGIIPAVFTRALDYDQPSDINNTGAIPVVNGTVNALTSWLLTSQVTTVGTDPLTYVQFSINPSSTLSNTLTSGNIFVGNVSNVATSVTASGDITNNNTGVFTLATVNSNIGTFGGATFNAKGLVTAATMQTAHNAVRAATTTALTVTYSNGTAGVGATLTNAGTQTAIIIDGVTLAANDRVLVNNQASTFQNGIYTVTNIGSGATNWVLTRTTDFDNSTAGNVAEGVSVAVSEGTVNAAAIFIENGAGPFTIGTTPITFIQNTAGSVTGIVLPVNGGTGIANSNANTITTTGANGVGTWNITGNGAASAAPFNLTGTPFAGTGTTSTPLEYFNNAVTQPTTWSTGGSYSGVNAASGFAGNFIDLHVNGGASVFNVNSAGSVNANNVSATGRVLSSLSPSGSVSAIQTAGTLFTGGTGTTTFPQWFAQTGAATPVTTWSTAGTFLGINSDSGFTGNFLDFRVNGGTVVFSVNATGAANFNGGTAAFNGSGISNTGTFTSTNVGGASKASILLSGTLFTGGTGTTNFPQYLSQPSGTTAVTTWSTSGTIWGANEASTFAGNFLDFHVNGGATLFNVNSGGSVSSSGNISCVGFNASSRIQTSFAAGASTSAMFTNGALLTGGSGTTNFPQWFSQPAAATAVTTWSTSGTVFGANEASGFAGNFIDLRVNGGTTLFTVTSAGAVSAPQISGFVQALTPGTTVAWNMASGENATLVPAQAFTLSNPTNLIAGNSGMLTIKQDATGSRVITWGSAYKFPGGSKFVLSTAANAVDQIAFYTDGTSVFCVGQAAFS